MKELYRLVYTSSRRSNCTNEEIQKILESCKRNNPGKNITGVLLHSEKRFLQYLEGDKEELSRLYDSISSDPRHGGVNKRDFAPIEKKLFPTWHMGYKNVSQNTMDFNTSISEGDKIIFKSLIEGDQYNEEHGARVMKLFFELAE